MSFSSRTSSSKGTVNADVKADKSPSKRSAPTQNSDEDEEKASVSSVKKAKNDIINSPAVDSKGLKIKLNQPTAKKNEPEKLKKTCVFGESSDEDEVEEMPPEAKMRMKNIGRDTQTSAGPNSFGKTRQGFCDSSKIFERQLKKVLDESK